MNMGFPFFFEQDFQRLMNLTSVLLQMKIVSKNQTVTIYFDRSIFSNSRETVFCVCCS